MDYQQVLEYILNALPMFQNIGKEALKNDLHNAKSIDDYLGNPHHYFKTIHVAGTNGKGSVSHMLASILMEQGYRVGLFTSPHFNDFRERIKVNGEMIDKDFLCDFINTHKTFFDHIQPSFFEMSVGLAFTYFKQKEIDIAIVETGLGGRLDATNIITPEMSIITNIGFDHMWILGDTLPQIAREKAGIIKPQVPVIIGETQQEVADVFNTIAKDNQVEIVYADQVLQGKLLPLDYTKKPLSRNILLKDLLHVEQLISCSLLGDYQLKNCITAIVACQHLKTISISDQAIHTGIERVVQNTGLFGRFQMVQQSPRVILDIAHNYPGIEALLNHVATIHESKLHLVVGFVADKDVASVLTLFPKEADFYFTQATNLRSMDALQLQHLAMECGLSGDAFKDAQVAYNTALKQAQSTDIVLVCGSAFLVADVLKKITDVV